MKVKFTQWVTASHFPKQSRYGMRAPRFPKIVTRVTNNTQKTVCWSQQFSVNESRDGVRALIISVSGSRQILQSAPNKKTAPQTVLTGEERFINNSQGETLEKVEIFLPEPMDSQFYMARSRLRRSEDMKIKLLMVENKANQFESSNIVIKKKNSFIEKYSPNDLANNKHKPTPISLINVLSHFPSYDGLI